MTTAIILAAGKSERMGSGVDKSFLSLVNKPVVAWSLLAFEKCADIDRIVLCEDHRGRVRFDDEPESHGRRRPSGFGRRSGRGASDFATSQPRNFATSDRRPE